MVSNLIGIFSKNSFHYCLFVVDEKMSILNVHIFSLSLIITIIATFIEVFYLFKMVNRR